MEKFTANKLYEHEVKKRNNTYLYILGSIFLYALFAFDRVKNSFSFHVDNKVTTNEVWIIPILCLVIFFIGKSNPLESIKKYNLIFLVLIYMYILNIAVSGFHINSIAQYIYAGLLFIIPMLLFFPMSKCKSDDIRIIIKFFIVICLIYAVFAIILSTNYAYFMELVGNDVTNYRFSAQYRASMMLGSSITVSYYFNLTLPLCFYIYFTDKERSWRIISLLAIIIIIIATLVLLSRTATLCTLLITLYFLIFIKNEKTKISGNISIICVVIAALFYAFSNYDLTRLLGGLSFSGDSEIARLEATSLGLYIFSKYPLFGSGMGNFFERIYETRFISVDDITGLIDPHNMYILILSELGIMGFVITLILFCLLIKRFSGIKEKALRRTAYIILFAFLFDAMGGSHFVNEISYSVVFWIYMGFFNSIAITDIKNKKSLHKVTK
ncbi:O-antigen ligase family protein [Filibacter tadaridae]|uniref:O-Antigen ligase n=1 Tax=Filibacter tadaridae TaxID=2483811 RepID=A0A3P5XS37_9BACL|nr:O-antigen ligase family protein [Filibacter tadaridae]VDC33701.1 O-Antigen ligase [Filibacter tadaridae]